MDKDKIKDLQITCPGKNENRGPVSRIANMDQLMKLLPSSLVMEHVLNLTRFWRGLQHGR